MLVIARWVARHDEVAAVETALARLVPAARAEPGVLAFDVYRDREDVRVFVLVERFRDQAGTTPTSRRSTRAATGSRMRCHGSSTASGPCSSRWLASPIDMARPVVTPEDEFFLVLEGRLLILMAEAAGVAPTGD